MRDKQEMEPGATARWIMDLIIKYKFYMQFIPSMTALAPKILDPFNEQ